VISTSGQWIRLNRPVNPTLNQYFLDHGFAVAEVDGVVVNTFTAGDFFGEISFVATAASLMEQDAAGVWV
jgi:hypothetical protein